MPSSVKSAQASANQGLWTRRDWWAVRMVSWSPVPTIKVTMGLDRYWRKVTRGGGGESADSSAKGSSSLLASAGASAPSAAPPSVISTSPEGAAGESSMISSLKLSDMVGGG